TRGWWASIFYFPSWWSLFSLYVTALLLTVAVAIVARVTCFAAGLVLGTEPRAPAAKCAKSTKAKGARGKRGATASSSRQARKTAARST
ncbi:MAG TPA: hypothetical protein VK116_00395, partial [Planctomycetota bacterium]|nr:hypothetical protein [Planctomycetota bacterium]